MKMYKDLYSDLSLLVPPFETDDLGFKIFFDCDETPELNGEISNPLLEKAEYKLVSTLTLDGVIKHKLTYQRTGEIAQYNKKWKESFDIPDDEPVCGSLKFILYFYVRDPEILKELNVKRADLDRFLKQYQGIRIYRDSFRVKPYGDPKTDEDWLGLNLMRVKHPGGVGSATWFLAANQVIGSVFITRDDNPDLQDQTNREGLVQNQAYYDLRNFLKTGINFLERERQDRYRKEIRKQQDNPQVALLQANSAVKKGVERLKETVTKIEEKDPAEAARLLNIAEEIETAAGQISIAGDLVDEQQSEKQMMVGLATLGIAVAAFGHETVSDVNMVIDKADLLKDYIHGLPARQRKEATSDLQMLSRSAERVKNWGQFALARIKRSKRVPKEIDINLVIEDILHAFKHALDTLSIKRETHLSKSLPLFYGFEMDIESVFINFITNSVEALRYTPLSKREIQVSTNYLEAEEAIRIRFTDSGKGIPEDDEQNIFSPLYSTKINEKNEPIGTGMGLTIVRDAVQGYSGEVRVKGKGKLGGAEFEILLPNPKHRSKGKD